MTLCMIDLKLIYDWKQLSFGSPEKWNYQKNVKKKNDRTTSNMKIHGKIMERPISTREHGETGKTAETWPYKPQQVGYKSCRVLKHLTYVTIVYDIEYVHHDTSWYRQRYNWVPCCCTIYKLKLPRYILETFMISGLRSWTRAAIPDFGPWVQQVRPVFETGRLSKLPALSHVIM